MYDEYIEDEDNIKIVESLRKGCFTISQDEWEQFRRIIIWKAAKAYSPDRNTKFTTYLWTKAYFEIKKYNNKFYKEQPQFVPNVESLNFATITGPEIPVDEVLECLGPDHRELISLRFVDNYSIREISQMFKIKQKECKARIEESIKALSDVLNTV